MKFAEPPKKKEPQTGKKPDTDSTQDQPSASSWEPSESTGPILPLQEDSEDTLQYDTSEDDSLFVLEDEPYWKGSNVAHRVCAQTASFRFQPLKGKFLTWQNSKLAGMW